MGWVHDVLKPRISLHLGATCIHRIQGTNAVLALFLLLSCDINRFTDAQKRKHLQPRALIQVYIQFLVLRFFLSLLSSGILHLRTSLGLGTGGTTHLPAQDWSCDTSGGDNTHRRCPVTFVAARFAVLHLSGSLICVGVLSKWAASREGWLPKGSHQRQYSY